MHKVRKNIIYAKECYEIIGMMYDVWNAVGYGHKEKFYQKAAAEIFGRKNKKFKEQLKARIKIGGKEIGIYFLDFLYEEEIVIELKTGENFSKQNINQIYGYLKATNLKLGLLVNFTRTGIKFKRVVNLR